MKKILSILSLGALFCSVNANDLMLKGTIGLGQENLQLVATRTPIAVNADVALILPNIILSTHVFSVLNEKQGELDYRLAYNWREHTIAIGINDFNPIGDFNERADVISYNFVVGDEFAFGGTYGKPKNGDEGYFVYSESALPFKGTHTGVNLGKEMITEEDYQTLYLRYGNVIGRNLAILNKIAYQNGGTHDGWYATLNLVYNLN